MQSHQNAMLMLADPPERPTHFSYKGLPYAFFARFSGPESPGFMFKFEDLHGRWKFGSKLGLDSPSSGLRLLTWAGLDDPPGAGTESSDTGEDQVRRTVCTAGVEVPGLRHKFSSTDLLRFLLERPVECQRDDRSQSWTEVPVPRYPAGGHRWPCAAPHHAQMQCRTGGSIQTVHRPFWPISVTI